MSTNLETLQILQERDRKIAELEREARDIPEMKSQIEFRLESSRNALEEANEELKRSAAGMNEVEVEIEAQREKIKKYREQQFQIKNNDEYRALENEIKAAEQQIRKLEDQELEMMEAREVVQQKVREKEGDLKNAEDQIAQQVKDIEKREQVIGGELAEVRKQREEIAVNVEPDWLRRYERIFSHVGDYAVVPVENGSCGGCHMKLTPQTVNNAKKSLTMTSCDYCGRILYWRP